MNFKTWFISVLLQTNMFSFHQCYTRIDNKFNSYPVTTLCTFLRAFCQVIWHPRNAKEIPMTCFDVYCQMLLWEILPICTPSTLIGNSHFLYSSCSQIITSYISCLITFLALIIGGGAFPPLYSYIFILEKKDLFLFLLVCVYVCGGVCVCVCVYPWISQSRSSRLELNSRSSGTAASALSYQPAL